MSKRAGKKEPVRTAETLTNNTFMQDSQKLLEAKLKQSDMLSKIKKIQSMSKENASPEEITAQLFDLADVIVEKSENLSLRESKLKETNDYLDKLKIQLEQDKKELEIKAQYLMSEKQKMFDEEAELRGKSKVDKILTILDDLKLKILTGKHNLIEDVYKAMYPKNDLSKLNNLQKIALRFFAQYEFAIENPSYLQMRVAKTFQYLALLRKSQNDLSFMEEDLFDMANGALNVLYYRLDWITNEFKQMEPTADELNRLFSTLVPAISRLAALDQDALIFEKVEKISGAFKNFNLEEKQTFMRDNFTHEYLDNFTAMQLNNIFSRILSLVQMQPVQILGQIERLDSKNRADFVKLLGSYLQDENLISIRSKLLDSMSSALTDKEVLELAKPRLKALKELFNLES